VEICPGVRYAAKYFSDFNDHVYQNPKVNFIPGDGRNYLLLSSEKYDIISCDPTHPTLGSGGLYTREYFLSCRQHLEENGVVCQYLPLHKLSPSDFRMLIMTFAEVFPCVSVWLAHSHGILVGTNKVQVLDFEILEQVKSDMLGDPYLVAISLILDTKAVKDFTGKIRINTDDRPALEFFRPASLLRENWEKNVSGLMSHRVEPNSVFRNLEDQETLARYLEGQAHFIRGLICQNRGDRAGVAAAFRRALEVNPENEEVKLFLEKELRNGHGY
jgi:spermidine synthase